MSKAVLIGLDANEFADKKTGEVIQYSRLWFASDEVPQQWQGVGLLPVKIGVKWDTRHEWRRKVEGLILEQVEIQLEASIRGYPRLLDIVRV